MVAGFWEWMGGSKEDCVCRGGGMWKGRRARERSVRSEQNERTRRSKPRSAKRGEGTESAAAAYNPTPHNKCK